MNILMIRSDAEQRYPLSPPLIQKDDRSGFSLQVAPGATDQVVEAGQIRTLAELESKLLEIDLVIVEGEIDVRSSFDLAMAFAAKKKVITIGQKVTDEPETFPFIYPDGQIEVWTLEELIIFLD